MKLRCMLCGELSDYLVSVVSGVDDGLGEPGEGRKTERGYRPIEMQQGLICKTCLLMSENERPKNWFKKMIRIP